MRSGNALEQFLSTLHQQAPTSIVSCARHHVGTPNIASATQTRANNCGIHTVAAAGARLVADFSSSQLLSALELTTCRRHGLLRAVGTHKKKSATTTSSSSGDTSQQQAPIGTIVDATTGGGADAALLAWHGWDVIMLEREASTHAALLSALRDTGIPSRIADRLRLHPLPRDAREVLPSYHSVDVVYLNPMFPKSSKKGKHEPGGAGYSVMESLQQSTSQPPPDLAEQRQLLNAALSCATHRVVVKRPIHAPPLAQVKPCRIAPSNVKRARRRVRYDIYFAQGCN